MKSRKDDCCRTIALGKITRSHIANNSLMFFSAYTFKGQVHVFAGQVKIVSHSSCRTSAILKYFCPLGYFGKHEDPDEMPHYAMWHFISVHTVFKVHTVFNKAKTILRENNLSYISCIVADIYFLLSVPRQLTVIYVLLADMVFTYIDNVFHPKIIHLQVLQTGYRNSR